MEQPLQLYSTYVDHLAQLSADDDVDDFLSAQMAAAIGDGAMSALRSLVPIEQMRYAGSFFTSAALANLLWSPCLAELDNESIVVDPAVGAGDLLFPALRALIRSGATSDLESRLRGTDTEQTFVDAARNRFRLVARNLKYDTSIAAFPRLVVGNALTSNNANLEEATHVVVNPPFSKIIGGPESAWEGRSVNAAAVFIERILSQMSEGSRLLAILPDVLRSGSRYAGWRARVSNSGSLNRLLVLDQFDSETDVHVFILDLNKGFPPESSAAFNWQPAAIANGEAIAAEARIGDYFDVRVGSVVPHRLKPGGPAVPYVAARDLEAWTELAGVTTRLDYAGRADNGPMVLVRRTSRPGESNRARATMLVSNEAVAVENHLLVLVPKDGQESTCRWLMDQLRGPEVSIFLNDTIRCRHLTVGAVKLIPIKKLGG